MITTKGKFTVALALASLCWWSCKKADQDQEFGNALLYIPQATVQSGGSNNNYSVTIGVAGAADTSIAVGLYRSGLQKLEAVSVELALDADTLQKALVLAQSPTAEAKYDVYKLAKIMPAAYYTVTTKLSLTNDQRESYELIKINKTLLKLDPDYNTKAFILPLRIKNPTKYSLNTKLSLAMFIFKKG